MKRSSGNKMEDIFLCWLSISIVLLPLLCSAQQSSPSSRKSFEVGVILDLNSTVGRIGSSCLSMALSDFYSVHNNYTTNLTLHVRDSKKQVIEAAASGLNLLKDVQVDAIIGPLRSSQANFLLSLGDRAHVPIISFSATSPSLRPQTPYFVQTTPSDETQVGAIAAIVKAFRWSQVVIIYEDSDYGNGIVPYLSNAFQDINARVSHRQEFSLCTYHPPPLEPGFSSTSVPLRSFQGLFAITGGVTALCLIVFLVISLYRNKNFLQSTTNFSATIWSRIGTAFSHFIQRDDSSVTSLEMAQATETTNPNMAGLSHTFASKIGA